MKEVAAFFVATFMNVSKVGTTGIFIIYAIDFILIYRLHRGNESVPANDTTRDVERYSEFLMKVDAKDNVIVIFTTHRVVN